MNGFTDGCAIGFRSNLENETGLSLSSELEPKRRSQGEGRRREREEKRRKKKGKISTMITLAHLFLLLLPGGVQETLPLPFLLRCHVSVPVGLHVVHPARSCVRVSRSFKRQKLDVTRLCYNGRPVTTGVRFSG